MLQRPRKHEAGLRNAANMQIQGKPNSLQIQGKGVLPGDPSPGGVGTRDMRPHMKVPRLTLN